MAPKQIQLATEKQSRLLIEQQANNIVTQEYVHFHYITATVQGQRNPTIGSGRSLLAKRLMEQLSERRGQAV
ncbi:MAG: hypothetical protein JO202_13440 [Ktedonobacteraceae bacterium]|nr:hypothetical protein [Ktedonobacteraceae bacterium]